MSGQWDDGGEAVLVTRFGTSDEDEETESDGGLRFTGGGVNLNGGVKPVGNAADPTAASELENLQAKTKANREVFLKSGKGSRKRKSDMPVRIQCICVEGIYDTDCQVCPPQASDLDKRIAAAQRRNQTLDSKALDKIESSGERKMTNHLYEAIHTQQLQYIKSTERVTDEDEQLDHKSLVDIWLQHENDKTHDEPAALPLKLAKMLKPHQIEGLRFLWANLVVAERRWTPGSGRQSLGCILAHSMGLGKTAQIVIFTSLLTQLKIVKHTLILAPKSTMSNWASEIQRWSTLAGLTLTNTTLPDNATIPQRLAAITSWRTVGGTLTIGYEQYCGLVGAYSNRGNIPKTMETRFLDALRDPGPDLVICDEGHVIRNATAAVSRALSAVKTNKRIILTGTPLQNHLSEYWTMIEFIRPGHFPKKEFVRYFEHPMIEGQRSDASGKTLSLMRKRAFILQKELSPFVHRRDQTILKKDLPSKEEYVVYCPLSKAQRDLFEDFRTAYLNCPGDFHQGASKNLLYFISVINKLGGHPDLLRGFLQEKRKSFDLGESTRPGEFSWAEATLLSSRYTPGRVTDSPKLLTLLLLVEYAMKNRQKLLVFSQYVQTLDFLEKQISRLTQAKNTWRLDGGSSGQSRADSIDGFQRHTSWGVFLISTRAGGVGINLCTAHKAVLFDVSFNPALDQQAIFRGYRYGLKHPVTIYRLVSDQTPEAKIFSSCVSKEWMAKKIIDHDVPSRANVKGAGLGGIYDGIDELIEGGEEAAEVVERLEKETAYCLGKNPLLKHFNEKLKQSKGMPLKRVMRHESLLLDDDGEKAGDEEKKAYEDYVKVGGIAHAGSFDGFSSEFVTGSSLWDLPDFSTNSDPWGVGEDEAGDAAKEGGEGRVKKKQKVAQPLAYLNSLVERTSDARPIEIRSSEFGVQKLV